MYPLTVLVLTFLIGTIHCSSVIIVGAGPAGIAAATRLLENNVTDILILEAEGRVGGRVHSVRFGDANVDLGAEWCHGERNNVVYEMVRDLEILEHTDLSTHNIYYSTKEDVEDVGQQLFEIINNIYTPDGDKTQPDGTKLGEYCIDKYNSSIAQMDLNTTSKQFASDFLEYFHHFTLSSEGAFSWFDPSAESDYRNCDGDFNLNWNGRGYHTVLDVMMKKYPKTSIPLPIDQKILLNKEVKKVIWDDADRDDVVVQCSDGTEYNAKHVIFTPSVGVLKHDYSSLFEPQLPEDKIFAIKNIGLGAVMKIWMHFPENWWQAYNLTAMSFVWNSEHRREIKENYPVEYGKPWFLDLFSIIPAENNPNVLSAWISGTSIPDAEKLDKQQIFKGLKFVLNKFFGNIYDFTPPDYIMRSTWYTNPHFRGTYSFQTVTSRQRNSNVNLARPLLNRKGSLALLFAGEATHPHYYSTVHGAIETGYREADRILDLANVV